MLIDQRPLYNRMASTGNRYRVVRGQFGTNVPIPRCHLCERGEDIDLGHSGSNAQDAVTPGSHLAANLAKDGALQLGNPGPSIEDQRFVLLELRGEVTFCSHQRLLAYIVLGDPVDVGGGDFDIVAEHLVIAHLERLDPGPIALGSFQIGQVFLGIR